MENISVSTSRSGGWVPPHQWVTRGFKFEVQQDGIPSRAPAGRHVYSLMILFFLVAP